VLNWCSTLAQPASQTGQTGGCGFLTPQTVQGAVASAIQVEQTRAIAVEQQLQVSGLSVVAWGGMDGSGCGWVPYPWPHSSSSTNNALVTRRVPLQL